MLGRPLTAAKVYRKHFSVGSEKGRDSKEECPDSSSHVGAAAFQPI